MVAVHRLTAAWDGGTATWSNAPAFDTAPLGMLTLSNTPDASILVDVDPDAGAVGFMLRFVSETCPTPRWPAELVVNPLLEVHCR